MSTKSPPQLFELRPAQRFIADHGRPIAVLLLVRFFYLFILSKTVKMRLRRPDDYSYSSLDLELVKVSLVYSLS